MDTQAIEAAVRDVGTALFGAGSGYGPTPAQWNMHRPDGMPSARMIVRALTKDKKATERTWTLVLAQFGLSYPSRSYLLRMALGSSWETTDGEPPAADTASDGDDDLIFLQSRYHREGLPVMWSTRPVMRWSVRSHRYVRVGDVRVLMAR